LLAELSSFVSIDPMKRSRLRPALLGLAFFLSGGAALAYQMVWSRLFAAGLGHEMPAVLAVVFACLGGMAAGAWALDGVISRSPRPALWYSALEILIGLWAILSAMLVPAVGRWAATLIGLEPSAVRHWAVALALPYFTLLPATAAMGASFPAMERLVAPLAADEKCVGAVYCVNTLGAMAGTLLGAFVVVPAVGFRHALGLLAFVNLVCSAIVLGLKEPPAFSSRAPARPTMRPISIWRLRVTIFATGLLGIGYEVIGVRVLAQVLENTVYTFAAVLSVYLLGTAAGAALYQRWGRRRNERLLLTELLSVLSLAALTGVLALPHASGLYEWCRGAWGDSAWAVLAAEMSVAAIVFALPTLAMGAAFSHLVQAARGSGGGVGRAMALNTLGGGAAAFLMGVWLLPSVGSKWAFVLIAFAYWSLVPKVNGWRWGLLAASVGLLFVLPANLRIVAVPPGGRLDEYREGIMASVAVVGNPTGHRTLRVNNRFQMGGTAAAAAEYRHAHIPLLLHPAPKRALFLGLGTGITLGAASLYTNLQSDGVELVPEVMEVMPRFEPYNFAPARQPRLKLHVADARRFVRVTEARYDVIVADLFHPAMDGAGGLYTVEHFCSVRERLAPEGLFCQWLPLHQLDETTLRVIVRTFLEVFSQARAWLLHLNVDAPVLGLLSGPGAAPYSSQWVEQRIGGSELEGHLKKLSLADSVRLFGCFLAGPQTLRAFAAEAPLNGDDQPRVVFDAPRFAYQKHATSYGRLLTLLERCPAVGGEALGLREDVDSNQFAQRLTQYMLARNIYLKGLIDETEGRATSAIDAFVESARLSEDFTLGYSQCLTRASLQAHTQPDQARALLQRLVAAQPSRPIAKEMLQRLFENKSGTTR
jgi:spermidine synthase